ncbi:MAG: PASTA domain-containing protein [Dehalococcoidia bacterium]|jgi:hypothetical protein
MANLLLDLNALLITAQDSGPDAFTAGKDIFACVASMGLNNQVDATAAGDLIKLAADLNKSAADIKADGGPADIQKFLTEVASVLNWVGTNGPGCFQAFMNLYGVFTTGGMSGGINALGSGGLGSFISAINSLVAIQNQAAAPAPAAKSGTIAVPNVVGKLVADASAALVAAGLALGAETNAASSTMGVGSIISQVPTAGAMVASGTAVAVTVSTGP